MSRCYPYPPPGYDKKAIVELALSVKKEKHKHKDKKKKRRKDTEANGDVPFDLDKRSKRCHQSGVIITENLSLANGSFSETKVKSSDLLHKDANKRFLAAKSSTEVFCDGELTRNCKRHDMHRTGMHELSLSHSLSHKDAHGSNGALTCTTMPSSLAKVKLSEEEPNQYVLPVEKGWSLIDDQEWLFHHSDVRTLAEPRQNANEKNPSLVLAEAVLLPSVGIYALPYVVPE